jgi:hypothetical protein
MITVCSSIALAERNGPPLSSRLLYIPHPPHFCALVGGATEKRRMDNLDFKQTLLDLKPGQAATLNYEMFEVVFPPGVEDDRAKDAAHKFAKANGCVIKHHADLREVTFVKDESATD